VFEVRLRAFVAVRVIVLCLLYVCVWSYFASLFKLCVPSLLFFDVFELSLPICCFVVVLLCCFCFCFRVWGMSDDKQHLRGLLRVSPTKEKAEATKQNNDKTTNGQTQFKHIEKQQRRNTQLEKARKIAPNTHI
jgi:hypothetical protein